MTCPPKTVPLTTTILRVVTCPTGGREGGLNATEPLHRGEQVRRSGTPAAAGVMTCRLLFNKAAAYHPGGIVAGEPEAVIRIT